MLNPVTYRFRIEKESVVKRKSLMSLCLCVAVLFFSAVVFAAPVPDVGQTTDHPIHSDASSPIALIGSGLNSADRQLASANEVVPLSGSGAAGNMLQFKAGGHVLGFQPNKAYLAGLDHVLSVEFLGTPGVMPTAASTAPATGNMGKAPALSTVRYQNLWDDISLTYESTKDGITESTYHVAPGGDVSKIRLRYNVPVESQADGSLKFKFDSGYLIESSPVAWQEIGEKHMPVAVAFLILGDEVGFSVGQYDRSYPLIIDPTCVWHTFYGSSSYDDGFGIAVDGSGNVYVVGSSGATWNGPTGQSPIHAYSGANEIFVLKLNSSGTYQWHTFYGSSSGNDNGSDIAIDSSSNIYVVGSSGATWKGPTGQSPIHAYSGATDTFVLKLNSSGAYQWHTFYGSSSGDDICSGIAIDSSSNVYAVGNSGATWKGPTGQSPIHAYSGATDAFVLKLNISGAYQWHTFYGSGFFVYGTDIAIDSSSNVYAVGNSGATWNGPTGQSPLHPFSGSSGSDIFVLKLNSSGTYQWHTFYGSGSSGYDTGSRIAVGGGNVYVTGLSSATWNGPTGRSPLNPFSNGSINIFVLKLNSSGTYQWHTFYGASGNENGYGLLGIALDGSGNVYVTGFSQATWNGPIGQSPLNPFGGGGNIFVLKLNSSGAYQWHTFYIRSEGLGIAVDAADNVYVTGSGGGTWGSPLHAFTFGGGYSDIFVLKMNGSSGNSGSLDISAVSSPKQVNVSFPVPMTITAKDGCGNTMSGFNGTISLTSSLGKMYPSSVYLVNGTATVYVTMYYGGNGYISASGC